MDNKDQNIGSIVKGNFFNSNFIFENIRPILLLVIIAFISIISSHSIDTKIYKIRKLELEVRELKSEFVSVRTSLMNARMGSNLQKKVKALGLESSTTPPHVIRIEKED
ncbi:MAG: S-adenosyl-methyltransferase [Flavobacteriales bacterium]|nr:S-adenosyl-methyltransferase [Flavobacteriales bacterium]